MILDENKKNTEETGNDNPEDNNDAAALNEDISSGASEDTSYIKEDAGEKNQQDNSAENQQNDNNSGFINNDPSKTLDDETNAVAEEIDTKSINVHNDLNTHTEYYNDVDVTLRKKRNIPAIIGIAVAAIVVIFALVFLCIPSMRNMVSRLVLSPSAYYQKIDNKSVNTLFKSLQANLILSESALADQSYDFGGEIKIASDFLTEIIDEENLSFKLNSKITSKSDKMDISMDFLLNDSSILDLNILADMLNKNIYVKMPRLSDDYILQPFESYGAEKIDPDEIKIYQKALELVVANSKNVQKLIPIIENGNKLYGYQVNYDSEFMSRLQDTIKPKLKDDKELNEIYANLYPDSDYSEFIDSLINDLEDLDQMTIYTDSNGKVKGRDLKFISGSGFSYKFTNKNGEFFVDATVTDAQLSTTLMSAQLTKNENGYSGNGYVERDGVRSADVAIKNIKYIKNDKEFELEGNLMFVSPHDEDITISSDFSFGMNSGHFNMTSGNSDVKMDINLDYNKIAGEISDIVFPEKYYTNDNSDEFYNAIDMDKYIVELSQNSVVSAFMKYIYGSSMTPDTDTNNSYTESKSVDLKNLNVTLNKKYFGLPAKIERFTEDMEISGTVEPGKEEYFYDYDKGIIILCKNYSDEIADAKDCDVIGIDLSEESVGYFDIKINNIEIGSTIDELDAEFGNIASYKDSNMYELTDWDNGIFIDFYILDGKIFEIKYTILD